MRKVLMVCGISFGILLLIVALAITGVFFLLRGEEQKPPQITRGEFPFVVEYEMNGEVFVIEDTLVCEFYGYDPSALTFYKPRSWNSYLKSGDEEKRNLIVFEKNSESKMTKNRINEESRVYIHCGAPEYYMGDPVAKMLNNHGKPRIEYSEFFWHNSKEGEYASTQLTYEQLEQLFGIKIIKFQFSEPIKNEFK